MAKAQAEQQNGLARSKPQGRPSMASSAMLTGVGFGDLYSGGFSAPLPGTYETYRKMRLDPTVALAKAVALGPIKAAKWSVEARDDAPEAAVDLINRSLVPKIPALIRDMAFGVEYGWAPFEKVWQTGPDGSVDLKALKPLLVDHTEIMLDSATGELAGVKNFGVELSSRYAFVYSHERECGDYYGRSRHENIRETAWRPWLDTLEKMGKYIKKAAGVTVVVRYPVGAEDIDGQKMDNADIAMQLLRNLQNAQGITMPQITASWAQNLANSGVDPEKLTAWKLDFLEPKSDHSGGFVNMLRYFDSLKLRGWLVPERVAIEGQHGTLAESGAHADVALSVAEETLRDMAAQINVGVVDDLLEMNFGRALRGCVELVPEPLADDSRAFFREITSAIITNPAAYDTAALILDVDAVLDVAGMPKAQEVVDTAQIPQADQPGQPPAPVAASRRRWSRYGTAVMGRSAAEILRGVRSNPTRFAEVRGTLGA